MFDLINGIPLHPLVVHAIVVLLPLATIGTIAIAVRPLWRLPLRPARRGRGPCGYRALPVATSSGEELEKRVGDPGDHAELGDQLIWFAIPLVVLAAGLVLARAAPCPSAGRRLGSGASRHPPERVGRAGRRGGTRVRRAGLPGRRLGAPAPPGETCRPRSPAPDRRRLTGRGEVVLTVGVCEDDPAIRRVLTQALRYAGHEAVVAHDGREALSLFGADAAARRDRDGHRPARRRRARRLPGAEVGRSARAGALPHRARRHARQAVGLQRRRRRLRGRSPSTSRSSSPASRCSAARRRRSAPPGWCSTRSPTACAPTAARRC